MAANAEFYFCILIVLIAGILGIIFSSIAIDKAKKLKDQGKTSKRSMFSLVVMLIISILITVVALIYGFELYASKKSVRKYYKQLRKMFN